MGKTLNSEIERISGMREQRVGVFSTFGGKEEDIIGVDKKSTRVSVLPNVSIVPDDKSVKSRFLTVILDNGVQAFHIFSDDEVICEVVVKSPS